MTELQLAKKYTPKKLNFPVFISEKLDGVPIRIDAIFTPMRTTWVAQSRQGKPLPSVAQQVRDFILSCIQVGIMDCKMTFIAEITHQQKYMPFKDVSGLVRRDEPCDELVLNFFDFAYKEDIRGFASRIAHIDSIVGAIGKCEAWRMIPQLCISNQAELDFALMRMVTSEAQVEGAIIRNHDEEFKPGKRTWGYQKYVEDPTMELSIVGYHEAISQEGEPLGMVGRIDAVYLGEIIGVGPGKLTHAERKQIWEEGHASHKGPHYRWSVERSVGQEQKRFPKATIKYKTDSSYTALRQPTFQHWREPI